MSGKSYPSPRLKCPGHLVRRLVSGGAGSLQWSQIVFGEVVQGPTFLL